MSRGAGGYGPHRCSPAMGEDMGDDSSELEHAAAFVEDGENSVGLGNDSSGVVRAAAFVKHGETCVGGDDPQGDSDFFAAWASCSGCLESALAWEAASARRAALSTLGVGLSGR